MSDSDLREEYETWLAGLQLRFFRPREITHYASASRNGVKNSLPSRELWENLPPVLWVLDQLRQSIDLPIRLTSIYRSPEYNHKGVKGSPRSFHMRNCAVDFQIDGMSPQQAFNRLNKMRHAGCFTGGLGAYSTFCHIDAGLRGRNATW